MDSQNKNTILAIALSVLVLIAWQFLYVSPKLDAERKAAELEAQRQQVEQSQASQKDETAGSENISDAGDLPNAGTSGDIPAVNPADGAVPGVSATTRQAAIANSARIAFENDHIIGSINLKAGRIDDLRLKDYHLTIDKTSPLVTLLSPSQTSEGYFAEFGFVGSAESGDVPGPETEWQVSGNDKLSPGNPVVLEWRNAKNVTFRRTISLDDIFLFTIEDTIENNSGNAISLSPYARVTRFGTPQTANIFVLHEGLIGVFGEDGLQEVDYSDVKDDKQVLSETHERGWLGITDKYWATALIPDGSFKPRFAYFDSGRERYQADYLGETLTVNAGGTQQVGHRFFGGAKKTEVVDAYQESENIESFDLMIDWGWFYFITKPLFKLMNWLYHQVGNFGVAILLTTVVIKAVLFPLANMSYASMAKMKKVQPEMEKIKAKAGDDRLKMQQEMMALYKREKINPAAGCWPMLIQIPVFFALYKVIYVTIEMRHAPFFGWIQDLSAPDPTSILNLFGLLPFESPAILAILAIGIWPLIMGITMFLQMQMNPAPPDPTQAMIFKWMPIVFTFMLATFPAGLVIYWAWNNTLSIAQQGVIMRKHGVKIELWDNLKSMFNRQKGDTPSK
ncbi:membrane protein insertase YidC [Salaquimonas pukyongi]|uniref:membrane protein insertase YidC n=1 Tax=Salaquimonas pukyongi TaxID=2712698 RepID=UPI00096B9785|nr:membrane protein insertase YidC [Salaquimonas pukyongi]